MKRQRPYDYVKRVFDFIFALLLLVLTLPIQLIVALLVRIKLGTPVLFKQERPGKDEKIFTLFKFRTMKEVNLNTGEINDEQRLTEFGANLRSYSLDELPSLINVIKGDMSMVGPRPLLVQYLPRYTKVQARRHEVRPGVTGLAQVKGRNAISWQDKFNFDVEYVEKRSFNFDLLIILWTIKSVFLREGINAEGHGTMPEFSGTAERDRRT